MLPFVSKFRASSLCNLNKNYTKFAINTNRWLTQETNNQETTSFGYQEVNKTEKQSKVNEVFTNVANKYDIMNDLMSFGLHRVWKNYLIKEISPTYKMKLIDVAGGTGDIAFRFLDHLENSTKQEIMEDKLKEQNIQDIAESNFNITVCDINESMLRVGQERSKNLRFADRLVWRCGNAENLVNEADNSYDVYTIAFGIRNCTNLDKVIKEAYRVLKPGGRFLVMEFSKVDNFILKQFYDFYSFQIIPPTGYMVAGDWDSYQYLVESIRMFPKQDEFAQLIKDCGFKFVRYENLTNGVVAIHSGIKL